MAVNFDKDNDKMSVISFGDAVRCPGGGLWNKGAAATPPPWPHWPQHQAQNIAWLYVGWMLNIYEIRLLDYDVIFWEPIACVW